MKTLKCLFIAFMAIGMASCSDKKSSNDSADDEEEQEEVMSQKDDPEQDDEETVKVERKAERAISDWDDLLDAYEEFIEGDYKRYIEKATSGRTDMDEYQTIVDKAQDFNSKFADTQSFGEMSDSQKERYMKIAERMYRIGQEARNK